MSGNEDEQLLFKLAFFIVITVLFVLRNCEMFQENIEKIFTEI